MARSHKGITEALAREIWSTPADQLGKYTPAQCRMADQWIADYALRQLKVRMTGMLLNRFIYDYMVMMVQNHMGSDETDGLLQELKCYPEWMGSANVRAGRV